MNEVDRLALDLRQLRKQLNATIDRADRIGTTPDVPAPPVVTAGAQLVGMHEVRELTAIPAATLNRYKRLGKMPTPAAELKGGAVWLRSDIETWQESRAS